MYVKWWFFVLRNVKVSIFRDANRFNRTAMSFLQITQVSHSFAQRDILKGVSFAIGPGSKTALAGDNGSGKTTLLKIVAGLLTPDSGRIIRQKNSVISYLPQTGVVHFGTTLEQEAETAFSRFETFIGEKREIEEMLGRAVEGETSLESILQRHHEIEETLLNAGYYRRGEQIHRILAGLGFTKDDFQRQTDEFSGGWQMRIALAKVLLERPDVLLLDEPTNYLDIEARNWLEGFLLSYSGGLIVVSHDRYFLDVTVSSVCELWNGRLKIYKGNFSTYEDMRAVELESITAAYSKQQDEIAKIEEFIRKFRSNASKAAHVQSRITRLEKMDIIEVPESLKQIHFSFPKAPHSGKKVLRVNNVSRSYGDIRALDEVSFELERGEKLVITGINGAGKSTLMRALAGRDRGHTGSITSGAGVRAGYFSQDNDELDDHATVYEEAEESSPTALIPSLRNILGAFLFRGDDIFKRVSVLSGGERSRLALLKLLLNPANLLILDEPTNHLDMASKQVLMEAMQRFDGTLVFVSHDRYFIEGVANRVLELDDGTSRDFPGDYEYYIWRKESEEQDKAAMPVEKRETPRGAQAEHLERKKIKSALKRLERREQEIMEKLDELGKDHDRLLKEMAEPEVYADGERIKMLKSALAANEGEQNLLSTEWNELEGERNSLPEPLN